MYTKLFLFQFYYPLFRKSGAKSIESGIDKR